MTEPSKSRPARSNGIGIGTVAALTFTVLKLTGVIAWSWWWVLAPLWIPAAVVLLILLVLGVAVLVASKETGRGRR